MVIKRFVFALIVLAIVTLSCSTTSEKPPTPDLEAMLQAAIQQTQAFENAVNTQLAQAAQVVPPLAATQEQPAQLPPTQESPTVQSTPSVPMLSVSMDSNCREGPSAEIWKAIGAVLVGQKAEIVAKYDQGHWYIVKNPANPNERCWVFDFYATIEGDTSTLPKVTVPPTPTPKP
jgi:hypothetical protein